MSERYAYPTWKEAINTAEKDINFQLTKLIKALETRHQALVDADNV
jgi:hypothetical protein